MPTIGVISFQGDFEQHIAHLRSLGAGIRRVREPEQLDGLDGLIIPGGESTTIGMLLERFGLLEPIRDGIADGLPVFGTCAGTILLADEIEGSSQPRIGGLHISVKRNAYGRQIESFEAELEVSSPAWPAWNETPPLGVFIRAPIIEQCGVDVETLLAFEDRPVLVRQGRLLAATFHPELTDNVSVHELFLSGI